MGPRMFRRIMALVLGLAAALTTAGAQSPFQNSCSQITFAFVEDQPAVQAVCLRPDGTVHATTLLLTGVRNQDGTLVQDSGPSTFQNSCGNIQIAVSPDGEAVSVSALCQTAGGDVHPTSLPLHSIRNEQGTFTESH
jgi:hypothetical protein